MKALVGAFNQEKALVGAFSVIVQLHRLTDLQLQVTLSTAAAEDPSAFILITKVFRSSQDFASKLSLHQIDEQQFTISN